MREKWMSFFIFFGLLALAWMPGTAQADIRFSGGVGYVGSEPGGTTFERIETYITGGTILFSSADIGGHSATINYGSNSLNNFGWTGAWVNDIHTTASGGPVTAMWWDYNFQGSSLEESGLANPFTLDMNYYDAEGFVIHEQATFSGGWHSLTDDVFDSNEYFPCGEECYDSIACTVDTCNELSGSCEYTPSDLECDDSNECTDDSCDAGAGCLNVCNATGPDDPCCDNPACSIAEACQQASAWGAASVVNAREDHSSMWNYLALMFVPGLAVLLWKGIRSRR